MRLAVASEVTDFTKRIQPFVRRAAFVPKRHAIG